jgi:enamine deaminase RidA (YjgF/YER057c/UK114 family)
MSKKRNVRALVAATFLLTLAFVTVRAQAPAAKIQRIPIPNSDFPISLGVWVPAGSDTLYLSGNVPPVMNTAAPKGSAESYGGNTEAQTVATIERIKQALESQKLSLSDVVMMHVYLVGDPAKENKMDFAGFMSGYTKYFGTKEQANKPARSAFQVAALAAPGVMIEIEVIAVRPH